MNRTVVALVALAPVVLVPLYVACGGNNGNLPPPNPPPIAPTTPSGMPVASTSTAPEAIDAAAPAPTPQLPPPALAAGTASPDPSAPTPTVAIAAPRAGEIIPTAKAADYEIKLDVKNWQTATGSQHVHLILDNQPYKAIYDTKAPIKLRELPHGAELAEGQHVLVAFPSRPNHESVKTPGALVVREFWVGKKGTPTVDVSKPMLVYSRPKGDYKGDMSGHILVDFQLVNTTLEPGKNNVTIAITGPGIDNPLTAKADKFGPPFYLDNAQNGKYTLKVELVGPDGAVLPGAWNSTTRDINVDRSAPAEPMPGMSMGGADAGAPASDAGH